MIEEKIVIGGKMFPSIIVDNFFPDPDGIVEYSKQFEYSPDPEGRWPGVRSQHFHLADKNFYQYFSQRILRNFYSDLSQTHWTLVGGFQKTKPFCEDQYHIRNRGWIHHDFASQFGGIVYLNKNPDPDTGTNLYVEERGYSYQRNEYLDIKEKHYKGEYVSEEEYATAYYGIRDQFKLTTKVEAVYNRLLLFPNTCAHGVETFGNTEERLTIAFFGRVTGAINPPLYRYC